MLILKFTAFFSAVGRPNRIQGQEVVKFLAVQFRLWLNKPYTLVDLTARAQTTIRNSNRDSRVEDLNSSATDPEYYLLQSMSCHTLEP